MHFTADTHSIRFRHVPENVLSVDVYFDNARVWSLERSLIDQGEVRWPDSLAPHLKGRTQVRAMNSSDNVELGTAEVAFTRDDKRVQVVDDHGVPLAVNKWGRLGKTLGGRDVDFQRRILDKTLQVIDDLKRFGTRPFVVGGTLLGGVRDKALLPHDDDADIAYLSEFSTPADVALEGFRLGAYLSSLGYEIVRHSATHMQLQFRRADNSIDYYVDVFSAFFTPDGHINQPFHVRGLMTSECLMPFKRVEIEGRHFPAPADANAWLTINYDENWRTPIPGFALRTPRSTQRRFQTWFGSFNFRREFWDEFHADRRSGDWAADGDWILNQLKKSSLTIFDFGCGDGRLTRQIAAKSHDCRVIGLDYSANALERCWEASTQDLGIDLDLEFAHINLYRGHSLVFTRDHNVNGPFDAVYNHFLEQLGHLARSNAWRTIRMALRSGGHAYATINTHPASDVNFGDPTTWHLSREQVAKEADAFGIICSFTDLAPDHDGARQPVGIRFMLSASSLHAKTEAKTMKTGIKTLLRRAIPVLGRQELQLAQDEIRELREEIDELRRDHLRIAELTDLVEQRLSEQATDSQEAAKSDE